MTQQEPTSSDERSREFASQLKHHMVHVGLSILALLIVWRLHSEIGEWLALTYVSVSLALTGWRWLKWRRFLKRVHESQSQFLPIRAARPEDFPIIEDIDKQWLAEDPAALIPARVMATWSEANHESFWVHVDANQRVLGYYSILNLKPSVFAQFKSGKIAEPDFRKKDVMSASKDGTAEELYFFSIAQREDRRRGGSSILIRHAADKIAYLQNFGRLKRLYASGASEFGRKLIKKLPFVEVMPGQVRRDAHDLYVLDLTKEDARALINKLGRGEYASAGRRRRARRQGALRGGGSGSGTAGS